MSCPVAVIDVLLASIPDLVARWSSTLYHFLFYYPGLGGVVSSSAFFLFRTFCCWLFAAPYCDDGGEGQATGEELNERGDDGAGKSITGLGRRSEDGLPLVEGCSFGLEPLWP